VVLGLLAQSDPLAQLDLKAKLVLVSLKLMLVILLENST
jgi:hypothetical protein